MFGIQEYSQAEANTAFGRTNAAHGWGIPSHSSHQLSVPRQVMPASMPLLTTQMQYMQQQMQAAPGLHAAAASRQVSLLHPNPNPSKPLSMQARQAWQALHALQAAQAGQAAQAAGPSAISKLARTFHWTSSPPLQALPSSVHPSSAPTQSASSSLLHHNSPSLSERAGNAKRAKRGIAPILDMFVQLPPLAYAMTARAAASSTNPAVTKPGSTALLPPNTQPARIIFHMPRTVGGVTNDGRIKAEGGSSFSSVAPAADDRQDQAGGAQTPAAPCITGAGGSASEDSVLTTVDVRAQAEREAGRKKRLAKEETALRVQLETQVQERNPAILRSWVCS